MCRPLLFLCLLFSGCIFSQAQKFTFDQPKMGTECRIILWHADSLVAAAAAAEAYHYADSLIRIFSNYLPDSEVSVINRQAGMQVVQISVHMQHLISLSLRACQLSGGAFNPAMGPLSDLWRKARVTGQMPPAATIEQQLPLCSCNDVLLDTVAHTVLLRLKGMSLDFGGIAKGYIAQQMLKVVQDRGIRHALVDAGGDICASKGYEEAWRIAVNLPDQSDLTWEKSLPLSDQAVATSGDIYQHVKFGDQKFSHIIDPRTGYGVQSSRNVTVIAHDGATADWLATACSVLSVRKAKKLAVSAGAHLLMTWMSGTKMEVVKTKHFPFGGK